MSDEPKLALVTGDCVVDHHWYAGERPTPDSSGEPMRQSSLIGGAGLLLRFVRQVAEQKAERPDSTASQTAPLRAEAAYDEAALTPQQINVHSYAIWRACPCEARSKKSVWRLDSNLGYGTGPEAGATTAPVRDHCPPADVLVLDDGDLGFRYQRSQAAWPKQLTENSHSPPRWIVLKMAAPLAQGDLWRTLKKNHAQRLVTVVSIRDLRREQVLVGKGSSWESTALDLAHELERNPSVRDLLASRHLIVALDSEGAFYASQDAAGQTCFRLIYDPRFLEGESAAGLPGTAVGFMSCLTAAIVRECAVAEGNSPPNIERGIRAGLAGMRRLLLAGHGSVDKAAEPGFPFGEVAKEILEPTFRFQSVSIPGVAAMTLEQRARWSIVTSTHLEGMTKPRPLHGLAARVARHGLGQFGGVPFARFGRLFTVDRAEIESLRAIERLMVGYLHSSHEERPLSLAVFGPPGSGKSFGVKQLADAIYQREYDQKAPFIGFNLSQFIGPKQLIGAFHAVRDKVLEGRTPLVFWDEFDSKEFRWLQFLLAPMQDGTFNEGQVTHPIGKCIFVFAGGTSYNFANFGPKYDEAGIVDFKLKKGPDFKSRLSGYLDVLGPNPRPKAGTDSQLPPEEWIDDETDICFPVRRALLIRSLLKLEDDERLDIDSGILSAMLELNRYKHGARSLEKIEALMSQEGRVKAIRRSSLPPRDLMEMHADYAALVEIANRDLLFRSHTPKIAPHIHNDWRTNKQVSAHHRQSWRGG